MRSTNKRNKSVHEIHYELLENAISGNKKEEVKKLLQYRDLKDGVPFAFKKGQSGSLLDSAITEGNVNIIMALLNVKDNKKNPVCNVNNKEIFDTIAYSKMLTSKNKELIVNKILNLKTPDGKLVCEMQNKKSSLRAATYNDEPGLVKIFVELTTPDQNAYVFNVNEITPNSKYTLFDYVSDAWIGNRKKIRDILEAAGGVTADKLTPEIIERSKNRRPPKTETSYQRFSRLFYLKPDQLRQEAKESAEIRADILGSKVLAPRIPKTTLLTWAKENVTQARLFLDNPKIPRELEDSERLYQTFPETKPNCMNVSLKKNIN